MGIPVICQNGRLSKLKKNSYQAENKKLVLKKPFQMS